MAPKAKGAVAKPKPRHADPAASVRKPLVQLLQEQALATKAKALAAEDFEQANQAKAVESAISVLVAQFMELTNLKSEAIWLEDFAAATAIQRKMQAVEDQAKQAMGRLTGEHASAPAATEPDAGATGRSGAASSKAGGKGGGKAAAAGGKGKVGGKKPAEKDKPGSKKPTTGKGAARSGTPPPGSSKGDKPAAEVNEAEDAAAVERLRAREAELQRAADSANAAIAQDLDEAI